MLNPKSIGLSLLFLLASVAHAFDVDWVLPTGPVFSGQEYYVEVTATGLDWADLYKNGQWMGTDVLWGGGTLGVWTTDYGPDSGGILVPFWLYGSANGSGESILSERSVGILGARPYPSIWVDGYINQSGATVERPYGLPVNVIARFHSSDPDGDLVGIRPKVWSPNGNLNDNGGAFIAQSGSSGEVVWSVSLNQNGNWYFWTDAQDAVQAQTGVFSHSAEWENGFRLNVVEAANQNPIMAFESAAYSPSTLTGSGWAADPEHGAAGIDRVEIHVDGVYRGNATLGGDRPDVASSTGRSDFRYSGFNFSISLTGLSSGTHTVMARTYDNGGTYVNQTHTFVVGTNASPPVITQNPSGRVTTIGQTVSFYVVATGTAPLSYQWYKGGNSIPGATSSHYTISPVAATDAGSYTVVVTNSVDSIASTAASLTIGESQAFNWGSITPGTDPGTPAAAQGVGALAANISVDNKGAANSVIPLKIPPGRAGLQPSLSLNYNSNGGNGPLGIGWSLSTGFPQAITRGRSILARDGEVRGVTFTNADNFYLDGKRLIANSGVYRTEVDSFVTIVGTDSNSDGAIDTFVATDKAGTKMTFGKHGASNDGYQMASGSGETLAYAYALKHVEDSLGNTIVFKYAEVINTDNIRLGEYVLDEILYTGVAGQPNSSSGRVTFRYNFRLMTGGTERLDRTVGYVAGKAFAQSRRLDGINVEFGTERVAYYSLEYGYAPNGGPLRLGSVTPYLRDGNGPAFTSFPATTVGWGLATAANSPEYSAGFPANGTGVHSTQPSWRGDFNGDGREDILFTQGTNYEIVSCGSDGSIQTLIWPIGTLPAPYMRVVITGDFNGDGRTDLVYSRGSDSTTAGAWYVGLSTGSGFGSLIKVSDNNSNYLVENKITPWSAQAMDLDGDGLDELVFQIQITQQSISIDWNPEFAAEFGGEGNYADAGKSARIEGIIGAGGIGSSSMVMPNGPIHAISPKFVGGTLTFTESNLGVLPLPATSFPAALQPIDLNGDGKMDLVATDAGPDEQLSPSLAARMHWRTTALLNTGSGFQATDTIEDCYGELGDGFGTASAHRILLGDVNGDGLTDFFSLRLDTSSEPALSGWYLSLSMGNGEFTHPSTPMIPTSVTIDGTSVKTYHLRSGALNSAVQSGGDGGPDTYVVGSIDGYEIAGVALLDYNGDGRKDFVWYSPEKGWRCFVAGNEGFETTTAISIFPEQANPALHMVEKLWIDGDQDFSREIYAADLEGAGRDSLVLLFRNLPGGVCSGWNVAFNRATQPHRVSDISDGLGRRTAVQYAGIASDDIYTPGAGVEYPIRENRRAVVVSVMEHDSGADGLPAEFSYQYSGNRLDLAGRGGLGFHAFVTLDRQTNLFKYQFLAQSFPMTGLTHREETYRWWNDGQDRFRYISSHDNVVVFDRVGTTGTVWPYISKAEEYRWEDGATAHFSFVTATANAHAEDLFPKNKPAGEHIKITAKSWFDGQNLAAEPQTTLPGSSYHASDYNATNPETSRNVVTGLTNFNSYLTGGTLLGGSAYGKISNGNLTKLHTDFQEGFTETVTTTYEDGIAVAGATGAYTLTGRPKKIETSVTSTDYGTQYAPDKHFTYWGNTPLVASEKIDADRDGSFTGTLDLTTTYNRGTRGRVESTQISSPDSTIGTYTVSTATAFDDKWDLPTTVQNNYGHTTSTVYHPFLGLPTSVTGANPGDVTTTEYDALGRPIKVTDRFGLETTNSYAFETVNVPAPATYPQNTPVRDMGLALDSKYRVTVTAAAQPPVTTYYDRLGRAIRSVKSGFNNQQVVSDISYNKLGQPVASSLPYLSGGTKLWSYTSYDDLGRVSKTDAPNFTVTTNTYAGRQTTVEVKATDRASQFNRTEVDAKGRTVKVWNPDPASGALSSTVSLEFKLDGFGRMRKTLMEGIDDAPHRITATYDALGRQTQLVDPDKGTWNYTNNVLGQVVSQTDANANTTTSTFDRLGRPLTRTTTGNSLTESASFHYYDTGSLNGKPNTVDNGTQGWIGAPQREEVTTTGSPLAVNLHYYDDKGRSALELAQIDGKWFYTATSYDTFSRPQSVRHYWKPAGAELPGQQPYVWQDFGYTYNYDAKSYLLNLTDSLGRLWWEAAPTNGYDHLDRAVRVRKGNGHWTQRTYRETDGVLETLKTGVTVGATDIQNMAFGFDGLGNLTSRSDTGVSETFTYDNLNRLETTTVAGTGVPGQTAISYFANGNVRTKTGFLNGVITSSPQYTYDANKPHAVATAFGYTHAYDNNGNLTERTGNGQTWTLKYAGFDKPRWMAKGNVGSEFHYNARRSRIMQLEFDSMTGTHPNRTPEHYNRKRLYALGSTLELNYNNLITSGTGQNWQLKTVRLYVPGPDGIIGSREFDPTQTVGQQEKAYVYHYDHLGSITAITDWGSTSGYSIASGNKSGRYSEESWGQRRDPLDWTGAPTTATDDGGPDSLTPRGFTHHEMLDDLGLVHMNGRIYDPLLGRMLSADILVQNAGSLQDYNRYSYVRNNPLRYTDPSGFATISEYEEKIKELREEGAAARKAAYEKDGLWGLAKNLFSKENRERGGQIIEAEKGIAGINAHADGLARLAGVQVDARQLDDVNPVYQLQQAGLRFFNLVPFASVGGKAVNGDFEGAAKDAALQGAFYWGFRKLSGSGSKGQNAETKIASEVAEEAAEQAGNPAGKLTFDSATKSWTSPQGLVYGQGSAHGNRVKHVLDHAAPNPSKPVHSVFNVERSQVVGLVDEAWAAKTGSGTLQANGNRVWVVPMGREVGTAGQTSVQIVVRDGTTEVITAFPK